MGLFVLSGLEDCLPAMFRLATLEEVRAHREEQLKSMPGWEIATLADGWVNGASHGGHSGSDHRTDISQKLIVRTTICTVSSYWVPGFNSQLIPGTGSFALYGLNDSLPPTFRLATLHDISAHREGQLKAMPGWEIANLADGWVDGALYGGRSGPGCRSDVSQKLACSSTICDFPNMRLFVLCRLNDWFPPSCRLATLHEVQTHRDEQLKAMPTWEIANLADGWVNGASYGGHSGPGGRNDAGHKLGIDIACCGQQGEDDELAITLEPHPSEELISYIEEHASVDGRRVKRTADRDPKFAKKAPSKIMISIMKELIALWVDPVVDGRQRSIVTHKGFRIDQQKNGGFDKTITDGGNTYTQRYTCLAVQKDNDVFADVLLPMGVHIGKTVIRRALYDSLENGKLVTLLPAPKIYRPAFKYLLTLGVAIIPILLLPILL